MRTERVNLGRVYGDSAYDIAVEHGFTGTEEEWINSLVGARGPQGERGPQGIQGVQGIQGPKGEQGEKGEKGNTGERGPQGVQGIQGRTGERGPKGDPGQRGEKGEQGERGIAGIAGVSIRSVTSGTPESKNGTHRTPIYVTLTDNSQFVFYVTTKDGLNGVSITNVTKTGTEGYVDTYTISLSDGSIKTFTVTNGRSLDVESADYTDTMQTEKIYYIRQNVGEKALRHSSGDFFSASQSATNSPYKSIKLRVEAGQIYRITGMGSSSYPTFVLVNDNDLIVDKSTTAVTDKRVFVKEDGWLVVSSKDENTCVRKVTVFDENANLEQRTLAAVPTIEEVTTAVLAALPSAEGGAF